MFMSFSISGKRPETRHSVSNGLPIRWQRFIVARRSASSVLRMPSSLSFSLTCTLSTSFCGFNPRRRIHRTRPPLRGRDGLARNQTRRLPRCHRRPPRRPHRHHRHRPLHLLRGNTPPPAHPHLPPPFPSLRTHTRRGGYAVSPLTPIQNKKGIKLKFYPLLYLE